MKYIIDKALPFPYPIYVPHSNENLDREKFYNVKARNCINYAHQYSEKQPNRGSNLLCYFLAFLLCYFCWQPAVFAKGVANSSPQILVTQEIRYSLPEAGEVFLVWGVNGWATVPETQRPPGTAIKNKIMFAPMERQSNYFTAKVRVPAGATIDYVFQITKTQDGSAIEIWDNNSSAQTKYYRTVAVSNGVVQIEAKITTKSSSPQTLVTQEIRYSLSEAGEVFLVWGVNGWTTVPETQRPPGTEIKNKIMFAPMERQSNYFTAKVRVPAGATIDYVFQITKTRHGSAIEIWDNNFSARTENYYTVPVQDGVTSIEAKTSIKNLLQASNTNFGSVFWWCSLAVVLILYVALLVGISRLNTQQLSRNRNLLSNSLQKLVKYQFSISLLLFIIACYFVFLFCLEFPSVRMWDESRQAVNALEMSINGNPIVTHFDGKPDLWNTKPPMLIWAIALSMKIFGYNTFALRLPSAICAASTAIVIFIFSAKYLKSLKIAWVSGLVLITSSGFVGFHAGRSGDYDAMLVLWITIYSLSYLIYLHSNELKKQRFYWSIATAALIFAVLTKSVAGFLPLPGIFLYTLYTRKLKSILFSSWFYISCSMLLVVLLSYYLTREVYNPGYFKAVLLNDLNRYHDVHENNEGSFLFYLKYINNDRYTRWIYLLPIGLSMSLLSVKKHLKAVGIFGLLYLTCYWAIVSFSKTKVVWYINPIYPISSLVIGVGLTEIFDAILNSLSVDNLKRQLIFVLTAIAIFVMPYFDITYNLVYKQDLLHFHQSDIELKYGDYFQQIFQDIPQLTEFTAASNKYNAHLIFYSKLANLTGKYSISPVVEYQYRENKNLKLNPGEVVVTCEYGVTKILEQHYNLKLLHSNEFCATFKIEKISNSAGL
ncbi:MAG: glycosyltransferase family 39 protein [Oscillatoriaceae cyanobacterium Prado104]|jgi:4-amino-4-deoxy-L-arabinose transferase-like glycosyltransferase|nr:glycosyltransferase family 39 protein [Oscillatoriaceae cyanobacterium Prado104]